jgi:hypothetical protein
MFATNKKKSPVSAKSALGASTVRLMQLPQRAAQFLTKVVQLRDLAVQMLDAAGLRLDGFLLQRQLGSLPERSHSHRITLWRD